MERDSIDECNNCHKRNRNDDERPNEQFPPLFVGRQKVIPWWLSFHPSKASPDCGVSTMCTCGKGRRLTRPETHLKLLITPCVHNRTAGISPNGGREINGAGREAVSASRSPSRDTASRALQPLSQSAVERREEAQPYKTPDVNSTRQITAIFTFSSPAALALSAYARTRRSHGLRARKSVHPLMRDILCSISVLYLFTHLLEQKCFSPCL